MKTGHLAITALLILTCLLGLGSAALVPHVSASAVPTNGLKLWWNWQEQQGLTTRDLSGTGNDGTLQGMGTSIPTWSGAGHTTGFYSTQYQKEPLGGGPTYGMWTIVVNGVGLDMHLSSYSVCAWFRINQTYGNAFGYLGNEMTIIGNGFSGAPFAHPAIKGIDGYGTYKIGVIVYNNTNNAHYWGILFGEDENVLGSWVYSMSHNQIPGEDTTVGNYNYNDNQWHLACGAKTYNGGSGTLTLWVDGDLKNTTTGVPDVGTSVGTEYTTAGAITANNTNLYAAANGAEMCSTHSWGGVWGGCKMFSGQVDTALIYNRAITQNDVSDIWFYGGGAIPYTTTTTVAPNTGPIMPTITLTTIVATQTQTQAMIAIATLSAVTVNQQIISYTTIDSPWTFVIVDFILVVIVTLLVLIRSRTIGALFMGLNIGIIWAVSTSALSIYALLLSIALCVIALFFRSRGGGI